jgi:hypothetical protein
MITGGIKFFEKSRCLYKDGSYATATSNEDNIKSILNYNKFTKWQSDDSNDTITEVIEIFFDSVEINRIFLININFKEFNVKYWNGASYIDFVNVVGVDGDLSGGIAEDSFDHDTAYYEFDLITTEKIKIECIKTQVVDDEKFIYNFYCSKEIGTLKGFPSIPREDTSQKANEIEVLSGHFSILKKTPTTGFSLKFNAYPYAEDYNVIKQLFDQYESFLVWLCGGRYEDKYFKFARDNWKLKDVFNMQFKGGLNIHWYTSKNATYYNTGFTGNIRLVEHI